MRSKLNTQATRDLARSMFSDTAMHMRHVPVLAQLYAPAFARQDLRALEQC